MHEDDTYFHLHVASVITVDVAGTGLHVTTASVCLTTTTRTLHLHLHLARPRVAGTWWRVAHRSTRVTTGQLVPHTVKISIHNRISRQLTEKV